MDHPISPRSACSIPIDQHTLGHLDCPACEKARLMTLALISPTLPFSVAAALWLDSRSFRLPGSVSARFIRETTEKSYRQYVDSLNLFFADLRLDKIHLGHIRQYQEARVTGAPPFVRRRRPNKDCKPEPCPASPKKANQELSILKMYSPPSAVLDARDGRVLSPIQRRRERGAARALTQEQDRWLKTALFKPRWALVYWYSVLAFDTSMSTNEIRALRIGDVNLIQRILNITAAAQRIAIDSGR